MEAERGAAVCITLLSQSWQVLRPALGMNPGCCRQLPPSPCLHLGLEAGTDNTDLHIDNYPWIPANMGAEGGGAVSSSLACIIFSWNPVSACHSAPISSRACPKPQNLCAPGLLTVPLPSFTSMPHLI